MRRMLVFTAVAVLLAAATTAASGSNKASRHTSSHASALITCGKTRTIGFAGPLTGPAASLGQQQLRWAQTYMKGYNRTHTTKIRLVQGDTQLGSGGGAAANLAVAHSFASNGKILAVTGPAGSQEVQDSIAVYKGGGLGAVSGSATRTALTRAKTGVPRETPVGYFFRTVPNDDEQGGRVASYILGPLAKKRVYIIDDQEAYSTGLADQVEKLLKAAHGTSVKRDSVAQSVSDFSSLITRIPASTQVVYIPWQLATKAQLFYNQLHAAGKGSMIVMGSDGLFDPTAFTGGGTASYVTASPVDFTSPVVKAYKKAHGGADDAFGLPSYTATEVNSLAIDMACAAGHGKTTRAKIRKDIPKVMLTAKASLLGFPVKFLTTNSGTSLGPGDMATPANFAVFKVLNGKYTRVA